MSNLGVIAPFYSAEACGKNVVFAIRRMLNDFARPTQLDQLDVLCTPSFPHLPSLIQDSAFCNASRIMLFLRSLRRERSSVESLPVNSTACSDADPERTDLSRSVSTLSGSKHTGDTTVQPDEVDAAELTPNEDVELYKA